MTDDEIVERWAERAAIQEYEANMTRTAAERAAACWVRRVFGRLPDVVMERINTGL